MFSILQIRSRKNERSKNCHFKKKGQTPVTPLFSSRTNFHKADAAFLWIKPETTGPFYLMTYLFVSKCLYLQALY